jgi:hypothetical protein
LNTGAIQIFANKPNTLKLHSWTNQQWNAVKEYLLSAGAKYFVFQFAIQNQWDQDIRNCNFACFVSLRGLRPSHRGRN